MPSFKNREPMLVSNYHFVNCNPICPPFPHNMRLALFGRGCFWGAERKFWRLDGIFSTAVGYTGGHVLHPTYDEVCAGHTGHNEAVHVVYDPALLSYDDLLRVFWEGHDPTQGMRQGNDVGTQYRSEIYVYNTKNQNLAMRSKARFQENLTNAGFDQITTKIVDAAQFYYAEDYHQQYLAKNPGGYCGLGGTGVSYV